MNGRKPCRSQLSCRRVVANPCRPFATDVIRYAERVHASFRSTRAHLTSAASDMCGPSSDEGPSSRLHWDKTVEPYSGINGGTSLPTPADIRSGRSVLEPGEEGQVSVITKPPTDTDYLQELIAIQQNGPKNIGFFGTRNMGFLHQQLIEILSYAMVLTGNHIFTSGATGTNAAVIRGALRAEKPELLTVVLPQSLSRQPTESQDLLKQVEKVIQMPENDELPLLEASRICNMNIIGRVQQLICFAFHDSSLLLETCREAKQLKKIVTLFYLD